MKILHHFLILLKLLLWALAHYTCAVCLQLYSNPCDKAQCQRLYHNKGLISKVNVSVSLILIKPISPRALNNCKDPTQILILIFFSPWYWADIWWVLWEKNNIVHFKKNKMSQAFHFLKCSMRFLHSSICSLNTLEKSKAFTTHFGFTGFRNLGTKKPNC